MKKICFCLILASILLVTGCVQSRYAWENYDQKLYDHYKNPGAQDKFVDALKVIISKSEASGRIPPGIFAEYGYVLYEKGNISEAIEYFKKEQVKWPESNVLMAKMISNAQGRLKQEQKKELASTAEQTVEVQQ